MPTLTEETLPGTTLRYLLQRKAIRGVYLRIRRDDGRLQVNAPLKLPMADIHALIERHQHWIASQQTQHTPPVATDFSRLCLWGHWVPVHWQSSGKRRHIDRTDDRIDCTLPEGVTENAARQALLDRVLRESLTQAIEDRLPHWCAITGHPIPAVSIRRMQSRWGSCQMTRRRLSINLTLAHYPAGCLDLVLVHELTHFDERHHNARFYQKMDAYFPEWRHWARLLKASPGALDEPASGR